VENINRSPYTVEEFKIAVRDNVSFTSICRALQVSVCAFNFNRIRKLAVELDVDISHVILANHPRRQSQWTIETVLIKDCTIQRGILRKVLIRLGLYTGICDICGIADEWCGKPLTIEIDHINGIHTDNTPENLRWLCPNCHSQTDTYRTNHSKKLR
jgi:hypothetical protein